MKFLLSHPSVAPFVQQVGRALWEANMMDKFATTLTDYPDAKGASQLGAEYKCLGE